jgi:hypothetical protein
MARWIRLRVAGATGVALLILLAPSAARADCPPLDVACMADELTDGAGDPGEGAPVDPGDPAGTVDGTGPSLSPITDRADQVLHGEGAGGPTGRAGASDGRGGPGQTGDRPVVGAQGHGPGSVPDPGRGATGPRTAPPTLDLGRPVSDPGLGIRARLGPILIEAARSIATVLLLFTIAGIFVLIQDRLDRRDPRLTASPLHPEVILFR